ncbi:nucleotidyltransferase domain-containing protein [Candidatus Woesearchaeota archaeon]|nr:nucleotidyltransferase domain-containing protein [Candidatus Woesearchaeota archaeon]
MKDKIKSVFFNDTLRRWHFENIVRESGVSRERANHYLKILLKEKFIMQIKPKGKMPYYLADRSSEKFREEKRFYGLSIISNTDLFKHLNSLKDIKTAILFGSFSRGDWGKSSDIDLFIYGNSENFEKGKFETKLKREIQLFSYQNPKEMKRELDNKLVPNICNGFSIKGNLEPFRVDINA